MPTNTPHKIGENQYEIDADSNLGMKVPVGFMLMKHYFKKC